MICRLEDKRCRQRFYSNKKNELAANNGDTLGEAVISVINMNSETGQQRKIQLERTTKNRTTSLSTIFSSEVLKDINQQQS
jgi:hypothetical protein